MTVALNAVLLGAFRGQTELGRRCLRIMYPLTFPTATPAIQKMMQICVPLLMAVQPNTCRAPIHAKTRSISHVKGNLWSSCICKSKFHRLRTVQPEYHLN